MIRHSLAILAVAALSATALGGPVQAQIVDGNSRQAFGDPNRPKEDVARDEDRKAPELIFLSTAQEGDKVVDFLPGGGYFTRILSKIVGPKGHVYAAVPQENVTRNAKAADAVKAIAANAAYSNVTVINPSYADFKLPAGVDIVWTTDNYHDMHNNAAIDMAKLNKAIFNALRPGGYYFVVDHAAAKGAGFTVTQTLHRSDPDAVKAEVLKAGFKLDTESNVLMNAKDDHTKGVTDPSLRGHTDQYIFRFKKPE